MHIGNPCMHTGIGSKEFAHRESPYANGLCMNMLINIHTLAIAGPMDFCNTLAGNVANMLAMCRPDTRCCSNFGQMGPCC
jgi:hypothetical protein